MDFWYMFPVGILVSTIATASGIGGAALFTPFMLIVLGMPVKVAVAVGLIAELFGFSSGLMGFAKKKLIDYRIASHLLYFAIPGAIIGVLLLGVVSETIIKQVLALVLILVAIMLLRPDHVVNIKYSLENQKLSVQQRREMQATEPSTKLLTVIGGILMGMVSAGLGEMNDYVLLKKLKMKGAIAAGTSVLVVAITVFVASFGHVISLVNLEKDFIKTAFGILIFLVPGVALGGQFGVKVSQLIPEEYRKRFVAALFFALAVVTLFTIPPP